jgi:hypothetical protein
MILLKNESEKSAVICIQKVVLRGRGQGSGRSCYKQGVT